jgi:hypothetical protein
MVSVAKGDWLSRMAMQLLHGYKGIAEIDR